MEGTAPNPEVQEPVTPTDPPQPDPAQEPAKPDDATLVTRLREAFDGETDNPELDAVAAKLTPEDIKNLPAPARAVLRAHLREQARQEAVAAEARTKAEQEYAARQAALAAQEKSHREREAALMRLARSSAVKPPDGAPPALDPWDPESVAASIRYYAQKGIAEQFAPLNQHAVQIEQTSQWDRLADEFPDMRKPDVEKAIIAHLDDLNKGINEDDVRAGKARWRYDLEQGARDFFQRQELQRLREEETARKNREAADRAASARNIGRSGGAGMPDGLAHYRELEKTDPEAALDHLRRNPAVKQAVMRELGITPFQG